MRQASSVRLQTRLTFLLFTLVALLVAIFVPWGLSFYENEQRRAYEVRALSVASLLAESIRTSFFAAGRIDQMRTYLRIVRSHPEVLYAYVFDLQGRIIVDGTEANALADSVPDDPLHARAVAAPSSLLQYGRAAAPAASSVLDVAHPVFQPSGDRIGGVRIGFTLVPLQQRVGRVTRAAVALAILFVLVGGVGATALSRRIIGPVESLAHATRRIAEGDLDVAVPVRSRDELGLLAESFNQMAARLKEHQTQLERRAAEARALYEIAQEIAAQIALEPTLQLIVDRARSLLGGDISLLALHDPKRDDYAVRASSGSVPEALAGLRFRRGEGLGGRVVATGTPMLVGDYLVELQDSPFLSIVQETDLRSQVAVPLKTRGAATGVLYVSSREPHRFRDADRQVLAALADHASIAIDNAQLYDRVRRHADELEAQVEARTQELETTNRQLREATRELEHLYRLSTTLQEPLSLGDQLERVLESARQVVAVDRFYIWVVDRGAQHLEALAGAGFSDEDSRLLLGVRIPLPEAGAMYRAYREGRALVFTDRHPLPPELRLRPPFDAFRAIRTRNFIVIPMTARGRVVGMLTADNKLSGQEIDPQTVEVLQIFASHAAVAVENARLFSEIEDKNRQLEEGSRHKSQFLANMSHELRTPLNAILGYTELIQDGIYGPVPERIGDILTRVQHSGRHLLTLINEVLDLSRIEAGELRLSLNAFSLQDVVQTVVTSVEPLAAEKGLALVVALDPDLPAGHGDHQRLTQVLLNLVGNAIKFTDAGEVRVEARVDDGSFLVSVADTGPGIPEADRERIFEEFHQVDSSSTRSKGGAGLGLSIARRIVQLHGGRLWVESAVGEGSTFRFTVPVRSPDAGRSAS